MYSTILQVLKVLLTAVASTKFRGLLFEIETKRVTYHFFWLAFFFGRKYLLYVYGQSIKFIFLFLQLHD